MRCAQDIKALANSAMAPMIWNISRPEAVLRSRGLDQQYAGIHATPLQNERNDVDILRAMFLFRWLVPKLGAYADRIVAPDSSALDSL